MTVAKGTSKFNFDLVAVQEVRWDRDGTDSAEKY
jgi:hypothetical protein